MSKKNKKFQKKKHKVAPLAPRHQETTLASTSSEVIESVIQDDPAELQEEEKEPDFYETDKYAHVKKDIAKILIIMALIFVILFVAYYLSLRTSIFTSFGDWIYKITNINIE